MTPACKKSDYQAAPRYQGSDVLTGPLFQWQNVCHPNGQKSTEKINISPKYPNAEDLVPELLLKAFPLPVALNQLLFSQKHSDRKIHLWEAFLSTSEQRISAADVNMQSPRAHAHKLLKEEQWLNTLLLMKCFTFQCIYSVLTLQPFTGKGLIPAPLPWTEALTNTSFISLRGP